MSFVATPEIKQLFCVIRLLFMIFLVLIAVQITLAKQKRFYKKSAEHAWTDNNSAVYKHLNYYTGGVQHLFDIAYLHSSLITSSSPIQNSGKFNLRTARINLVQDNTEIIDRHKNWNTVLFKGALKIQELNPILNSVLKVSKELQLF